MITVGMGSVFGVAQTAKLTPYAETLPNSVVKMNMIPVPGGKVKVGDKEVEVKPYWIAETETVWEAFDLYLASGAPSRPYDQTEFPADAVARPSKSYILPDKGWGHAGFPVINVASLSAEMFCRWLSKATGKKYRLPTEAEWEWACREADPDYKIPIDFGAVAWFADNSQKVTHPVAKKQANKLGIYDMYGNVGEWTTAPDGEIVLRGGRYLDPAAELLPTIRRPFDPNWQESDPQFPKSRWWLADGSFCGFRVVCEP